VRRVGLPLLLLLAGCGRSDPLFPRKPAGTIASGTWNTNADAGSDASFDGGIFIDAGFDGGILIDAGFDAGPPPSDGGPEVFDGGYDAGFVPTSCNGYPTSCPVGFFCDSDGFCELDGQDGALQVTLRWVHNPRLPEDLDLHVIEPTDAGDGCEIYYGSQNSSYLGECMPVGSLDLDANAACPNPPNSGIGEDTENVIYPPNVSPPPGHYVVRVDYWKNCSGATSVPFTIAVRKGSVTTVYSGIVSGPGDNGGAGSGTTIAAFDFP